MSYNQILSKTMFPVAWMNNNKVASPKHLILLKLA